MEAILKNPYHLAEQINNGSHEFWTLAALDVAKKILADKLQELHNEFIQKCTVVDTQFAIKDLTRLYEALWKVNHQHNGIVTKTFSRRK